MKKLTLKDFINKANLIHNNKYDYSKVEYVNSSTKVCIICPKHGEFWQTPRSHLIGQGCPLCNGTFKLTNQEFIEKANKIHNNKYDYSKVEYVNNSTKVCIICPKHGEFWQTPHHHLNGHGCSKCRNENNGDRRRGNVKEFIEKANKIHKNKYDYSKVEYINSYAKVCIICPEHGEFWQSPYVHIQGHECPECAKIKRAKNNKHSIDEFIQKSKLIHGDKYDYSKVEYINSHTKVCIICPEHGEFWQRPCCHTNLRQGCPFCNESQSEMEIEQILCEHKILYIRQKRFDWLGKMSLDFYLPNYGIAIECQGKQHFESVDYFGGEEEFKLTYERDLRKKQLCEKHNIKILYYANYFYPFPYNVFNDKNTLISEIKNKFNKLLTNETI